MSKEKDLRKKIKNVTEPFEGDVAEAAYNAHMNIMREFNIDPTPPCSLREWDDISTQEKTAWLAAVAAVISMREGK